MVKMSTTSLCFSLLVICLSFQCSRGFESLLESATKLLTTRIPAEAKLNEDVVPSPNCHTLECPPYDLIHSEPDFEIRRYTATAYVQTEVLLDVSFNKATYRGFKSLFNYIQGANLNSTKIAMTAPVLTYILPSGGPFCSSSFIVKFYVPKKFTLDPPVPSPSLNPTASIFRSKTECVAIRRFPGFANDFNVADEAATLEASLAASATWKFITTDKNTSASYVVAQYNSPFEFWKRTNEIWAPFAVDDAGLESCIPSV